MSEKQRDLLTIENLAVEIDGKEILHEINLSIGTGEIHALFGPNGSGKTTLLMTIMGFPRYKVTRGRIVFQGEDLGPLSLDERARLGIGMSFQRPPVVRGVRMKDVVMASMGDTLDAKAIETISERLNVGDLLEREINHGFSGGEIKRSELMQLLAQGPDLVLLDEPESGVDLVNMAVVGKMINELLQKEKRCHRLRSGLIITHTGHILDYVQAGKGHIIMDGRIISDGEACEVLECIKEKGFEECGRCQR
ncbi:ABC transporter ATP-binding protein [candidate division NPL-UPA2 bacterium]|nr:ABC transporter ATP-binding protein [candidate division NPL-UPA2 bacterium]